MKTAKTKKKSPHYARSVERRKPRFQGWLSSDEDEIERRRIRGSEEPMRIVALEPEHAFFGSYEVISRSSAKYTVEIRSLTELANSCECPDYQVNALGTCKHIEATLLYLQKGKKRKFKEAALQGSPRLEIFLDHRSGQIRVTKPAQPLPTFLFDRSAPARRSADRIAVIASGVGKNPFNKPVHDTPLAAYKGMGAAAEETGRQRRGARSLHARCPAGQAYSGTR
jgi:hypothetical protein